MKYPAVLGDDEDRIYDAILTEEPLYPPHIPKSSVEILQGLLKKQPNERLGTGPQGAQHVKDHPFFVGIIWDDIYHKRVQPPFVPEVDSSTGIVQSFCSGFAQLIGI